MSEVRQIEEDEFGTFEDEQDVPVEVGCGYVVYAYAKGLTLSCTGNWTREASEALSAGQITRLALTSVDGFSERSLEFLEDWPNVRELVVIDRNLEDISAISRMSGLVELSVEADSQASFDLRPMLALSSLFVTWTHVRDTIRSSTLPICKIGIWGMDAVDLGALRRLEWLERVEIIRTRTLESVSGIEGRHVHSLRIAGAPGLSDLGALAELPDLEELTLESCRGVGRLDSLADAAGPIRELWLDNCGRIDSLHPVSKLSTLEVVVLSGDTTVVDGDLTPLRELPQLRTLRTPWRRHYSENPAGIAPSN